VDQWKELVAEGVDGLEVGRVYLQLPGGGRGGKCWRFEWSTYSFLEVKGGGRGWGWSGWRFESEWWKVGVFRGLIGPPTASWGWRGGGERVGWKGLEVEWSTYCFLEVAGAGHQP